MLFTEVNGKNKKEIKNIKKWNLKEWIYIIIGIGVICGGGVVSNIFKPVRKAVAIYQAPTNIIKLEAKVDSTEKVTKKKIIKLQDVVEVSHININKMCSKMGIKPDTLKKSIFNDD